MAFLCPVRIRRNKKKKPLDDESLRGAPSMGRITGSASIETLVRVGLEKEAGLSPESKMVVLHDFSPCVDDELSVRRGQIVHVLYQENDWVYVISEDSREGFIPHSYTAQFGSQLAGLALNVKKKMPREQSLVRDQDGVQGVQGVHGVQGGIHGVQGDLGGGGRGLEQNNNSEGKVNSGLEHSDTDSFQNDESRIQGLNQTSQSRSSSLLSESSSLPEVHPFFKDPYGRYIVLYSYTAQDENDLSVERGQCVTVLNKDDPEWFWVLRSDSSEGFVPAGFVYPLDAIHKQQSLNTSTQQQTTPRSQLATPSSIFSPTPSLPSNFSAQSGLSPPINQLNQLNLSGGETSGLHSSVSVNSGPLSNISGHQSIVSGQHSSISGNMTHSTGVSSSGGSGPNSLSPGVSTAIGSLPTGNSGGSAVVGSLNGAEQRFGGTELVMLYDYKAQAPDDLSVRRGEWVYADLQHQTVDGWLWAYAPKTRKYGFIPKAYARPPAMTSL